MILRLPEFDRLPENPPGPRRPDPEEPSRPDEFANELQRANTPPARRPVPARPEEKATPEKSTVRPRAMKDPRKPKHDDHDPPPPQNPTAGPTPPPVAAAGAGAGTATGTGTDADADADAAKVTATATATATAPKAAAAEPAAPDDTAALDDSQIPAAEPTPAAASALLSLTATLPDSPTAAATAPATAATDKPAANPLAAAIEDAQHADVTIAFSGGGNNTAPHTGSNGAGTSADGGGSKDGHAADALLGMRLGAPVRPLGRATGFARFEGELAPGILPRSQLHDGPPRVALPTLPIERPEAAEPTDPAAQPGHHRADLTVGEGDQKIVVSVMASEHQVRVHARAVSGDETAALRAGADELRGALKKQGLELAYLGAETMGGRASQEQGAGRGPQRDESRQTNDDTGLAPVDEETARPDVRVLA